MLASPYYGTSGEVIEIDVKQSRVRVQLHVPPEPDLQSVIDKHQVGFLQRGVCLKKKTINFISAIRNNFIRDLLLAAD